MLYLTIDTPKDLYVTLWESSSNLVNPYFVWNIRNKQTLVETTFTGDDLSSVQPYYNIYNICASSTQSGLTQGIVQVTAGEYEYKIYQMSNQYDLNLNNAIGVVENGILVISSATYSQIITLTQSTGTITTLQNLNRI